MSFLDDFFDETKGKVRGEASKIAREGKFTQVHDRWDDDDYQATHQEVKEMRLSEKELREAVGDLAAPVFADEFWSLVKAIPRIKPVEDISPAFRINAVVQDAQMELHAYDSLRAHSVGDPIGTALSCVEMEPHLEVLYDKLSKEKEMAEKLQEQMQQYLSLQEMKASTQEELESVLQSLEPGEESEEAQGKQQDMDTLADQMEVLKNQIINGDSELAEALDGQEAMIHKYLHQALSVASRQAELSEALGLAWGLEAGGLKRLDPTQRLDLAKKLKSEKFRKLAELVGPMMRLAFGEQKRKTNDAPEEMYEVVLGNDIDHLLPQELAYLGRPELRSDWMLRFSERRLLQYQYKGEEKVAKGGIIYCEDGSSSMSGGPEVWSKAVGLALLHIAKAQKRPFTGIHFGGKGEFKNFVFDTSQKDLKSKTLYKDKVEDLEGFPAVIDFAECFFCGGTDFMTPFDQALLQLQKEHDKYGAVKGDIVFCTDGRCQVDPVWEKKFKEEQERLQFRVYGIVIGGHKNSEPLNRLCDGRVVEVRDLVNGTEIKEMFGEL